MVESKEPIAEMIKNLRRSLVSEMLLNDALMETKEKLLIEIEDFKRINQNLRDKLAEPKPTPAETSMAGGSRMAIGLHL